MKKLIYVLLILSFFFVGCRRNVQFSTVQEGSTYRLSNREGEFSAPGSAIFRARTFGNTHIEVKNDKYETFYSTVPLRVRPHKIVLGLFFIVPIFFIRDPYRFCEIDLEKKCIRSSFRKNGPWVEHYPTEEQMKVSKSKFVSRKVAGEVK